MRRRRRFSEYWPVNWQTRIAFNICLVFYFFYSPGYKQTIHTDKSRNSLADRKSQRDEEEMWDIPTEIDS